MALLEEGEAKWLKLVAWAAVVSYVTLCVAAIYNVGFTIVPWLVLTFLITVVATMATIVVVVKYNKRTKGKCPLCE